MMSGPYIVTSPVWPVGTALPWASRIASSSVGTGWPTELGLSTASLPEMAVATDDDSVSPYAFVVVLTFGNVSCTLRWSSSADGEPPNATLTDRRRVVVVTVGVLAHPPDHGRNRGPQRDLVVLDELERLRRIEAPFDHHQLDAGDQPDHERRMAAGHVEQRRREEGNGLAPALRQCAAADHDAGDGAPAEPACSGGWRSCCDAC